ncbi:uncharacterized protein [Cicer arietinum]|uniref:Uncharacterized protein LOC101489105 isoform X2 n=1 Tax=Cicer arietinum TaxID=3827 RepID=A0A1S3E9R3_CICAR|nr:uncharacterized protein LOC101489105 isoform X2 [Cicer arietinum]
MVDSKRWTVTYTKHINQKRKVYQDGFLVLNVSTSKLALYDECEKLLECRLLKNDEAVTSGETLAFNGHLVDIGSLEGENKPQPDLNVDRKHMNVSRLKTPSEFKKRELLKYASPKISQEQPKPSTTEWQVLYTNQLTQKAKKYHDGFLGLVISGSRGAQVRLFDASRNLLDSRFLKNDDIIKPGESIRFDTYLVDISEDQGSHTPGSNVQNGNFTNLERMEKIDRQKSLDTDTLVTVGKREWQVLYTTQLTQKAKKYHDGFLQLEFCGSLGRQVVLCDLSKRPLERRFLKKDEVIRAGESVYFNGHLVDVGDPEGSGQSPAKLSELGSSGDNVIERGQLRHGQKSCHKLYPSAAKGQLPSRPCLRQDAGLNSPFAKIKEIKSNKAVPVVKPLRDGQPPSQPCLQQDAGLNSQFAEIEVIKSNKTLPISKPLRDVNQILSFLQDPKPRDCHATGVQSPNKVSQNVITRESTETMKYPDITSTQALGGGGSSQFSETVKMTLQSYSDKEAQEDISETNFDLLISSSGGHSCLISPEGESAGEFSERETFPSFDLGI